MRIISGKGARGDKGNLPNRVFYFSGSKWIREPKLTNSEVLQNLQKKVSHLKVNEQEDIKKLLFEFQHLFPDVPSRTTCMYHDGISSTT